MVLTKQEATTGAIKHLGINLAQELHNHKSKYVFQGIMFIIAGVLAGLFPALTALNVELVIGAILFIIGVLQLVLILKSRAHSWSVLSALLSIGFGIVILWKPLPLLLAFVTLLAIFMAIEGVLELCLSFHFRQTRNWGWMSFSGIITLLLAIMLFIGFPYFDALYLGWVIAINLVLYGTSLLMLVWGISLQNNKELT